MSLLDRFRQTDHDRVAILGLAGVPYSVVRAESVPILSDLFEDGTDTRSVLPPDEHAVWPAVMAGRNPGHTGVFGLVDREVGHYQTYVPQGGDVQVPRIWDLLEATGRQATVVNVPVTNPPQKEVDRMVSGPLAPDLGRGAHPEDLRASLEASEYRIDVDAELGPAGAIDELVADAIATLEARVEAFTELVSDDDWDLFVGCITAVDRVNHFLYTDYVQDGPEKPALESVYTALDDAIGTFLDTVPEDVTLAVVGDHGFAPLEYEVHCNRWLEQTDWLSYDGADPDALADISDSTRAYALSQGRFYLNVAGREPRGSVPEAEYESVRSSLASALREWTDPDGNQVIQAVHHRETLYDGPHVDLAPDLIAVPEPGYDLVANFTGTGDVFGDTPRTGMHTTTDVPLAIDHPAVDVTDAGPFDLTPTVLDLLDVDEPEALSGQSLYTE